ncbi:hypothetical protein [Planctomycetes bacterium K23_9]|uniref:DUF2061 domain-containing protein n=1 Tax=Stieleria marina TaxID=1930275 RepID=A0A517NPV8_9BACT|nr:hypothetical protein K239x_11030 [Planctomycetes bacterium K23_9]
MIDNFVETRARSVSKSFAWRFLAVLNSFTVLTWMPTSRPITYAIAMNVSGFFLFYFFERGCNKVSWGRVPANDSALSAETETKPA